MKRMWLRGAGALVSVSLVSFAVARAQAARSGTPPPPPPTIASAVDRQISTIEKELVDAAEAMPEDKFDFSPESLKIPGARYEGVRTFAVQVKHVAASNY